MSKLYGFLLGLMMFSLSVSAQTKDASGKVTDSRDGTGLPGVTVTVKNGTANTVTDADGSFRLSVPQNATTLVFSYVGYQTVEQAISNQMEVSLTTSANSLNEVVVVGYGTRTRREVTGSVAKVSAKEIANTPATSFESAIQGRAAGVFVEQENGKVGQGIKVRIRGASSVTAGNEPLYVIDGIPVITASLSSNGAFTNPLSDINMNDIESVEILKDASAAAIYGARASNGVVIITTKKGKSGQSKVEVNLFTGWQEPTRRRKFMNSDQYVDFFTDASVRGANYDYKLNESFYQSIGWTLQDNIDDYVGFTESRFTRYAAGSTDWKSVNTNWEDQAFQSAPISQADVNFSGGNDRTTYYMAGQVLDQKGILVRNGFRRYSGRLNLDQKVKDWLNVGLNMSYARSINNRVSNDNAFSTPLQAVALSPITPVIDPRTGLLSGELDNATGRPNTNFPVYYNPMLSVKGSSYNTNSNRTLGNFYAEVKFMKGLSLRTEYGIDQLNQTEEAYYGPITVRNVGAPRGSGFYTSDNVQNYNVNSFFKYNSKFGEDHNVDAVLGMSYQDQQITSSFLEAEQFPSDAYRKLDAASSKTDATTTETKFTFTSYFARANYKLKDRYLLSLSGRFDASSRFGPDVRWGFFPAASAGWIVSEEDFFQEVGPISFFKLKASYGLTGNAEIGNFAWRGLWSGNGAYAGTPGQLPIQLANRELKWESSVGLDGGFEMGFWNNRISIEFDYYLRNTRDLLLNVQVPSTTGFTTQLRNVGKLRNSGVEFTLNTENISTKNFRWTSNINFARNRNKILDLDGQKLGASYNRAIEGQPIGVFVAREYAGVDPSNGDALYFKNTLLADGKRDRATTNDYNEAEEVVIGNPNPDIIYGFRNVFTYSGIELDVLLQGVYGNDIYDGGGQYYSASGSNGYDNQTLDQLNAWKNPGDITNVPEARLFYPNGTDPSSRYLLNGSYLRVKALSAAYTLPTAVTSRWGVERVRLYVRGQNLFTFTKYKGWDPEVNADYQSSNINQGVDFYSAPQIKSIIVGVNIGF